MNTSQHENRRHNSVQILTAILVATSLAATAKPAPAATLADQAHSLKSIPADAAFYTASLRMKEQVDLFLDSGVYRKLLEIPFVQLVKMQVGFQWQQSSEPTVAKVREYIQSAAGQDAVAVAREMISDEMFCYGNQDIAALFEFMLDLQSINRTAKIEAAAKGEPEEQVLARRLVEKISARLENFQVPDLVLGFRIHDAQRAVAQLDQIQSALGDALKEQRPELASLLQREKVGGNDFLTLRLDGSLIPWEEIREGADNINLEQFEKWKSTLSGKTAVVAVGVVGEFVVVSFGDSTNHLEGFGTGALLADLPVFARLNKHAGERITAISYMSEILARTVSSPTRSIDDMTSAAEEGLNEVDIDNTQRQKILADVHSFGADIVKFMPQPGATLAVEFLTSRGGEGFKYYLGTKPKLDSTQRLSILNHLGGNPFLCIATHSEQSVEDYDLLVNWLKRFAAHAETIAEAKAPADDWATYQKWRGRGVALLQRLDKTNRESLIPAMAGGQSAVIVDVNATSTQWFNQMPASPAPLPMFEIGLVGSVSDAAKLRAGVAEYRDVIQQAINLVHEISPDDVPEYQLPPTESRTITGGTIELYPQLAALGVDDQVAPNGGVTNTAWAVTPYPAFTEKLLTDTPLAIDTSLKLDRPAATVTHCQFNKLWTAIGPWIDYGFDVASGKLGDGDNAVEGGEQNQAILQAGFILPQIHQLLDVLAAVRSHTSISYFEDGAWVTHAELHVVDLE